MSVNENECVAAGLDLNEVKKLTARLTRIGRDAQRLGLTVFGGSGSGTLRSADQLIVADIDAGDWDGGDGACWRRGDGLLRGET